MTIPTTACAPGAIPGTDPLSIPEPRRNEGLAQVIELFPSSGSYAKRPEQGADPGWSSAASGRGASAARGAVAAGRRKLRRARRRWAVRVQLVRLWLGRRAAGQHGMATAEYAIATLGAVAFAGLLVVIMRSDEVRGFLLGIIRAALAMP